MFARFVVDAASYVAAVVMAIGPIYAADYQDNLLSVVVTVRRDYPTPMAPAQAGELVTRVAHIGGPEWGVLLKDYGSNCPSPMGLISCDILVHIPSAQEYDILEDAEGKGVPRFEKLPFRCGQPPSGCEMARVRPVALPTPPPPTVPPTPPAVDLTPLLNRLAALENEIAVLKSENRDVRAVLTAEVADIRAIIAALPPASIDCSQLPLYKGWFGTSKPVCK